MELYFIRMLRYIWSVTSKGGLSSSNIEYIQSLLVFATTFLSITYTLNVILTKIRKNRRTTHLIEKFPGPKKYPLVGNIPQIYHIAECPKKIVMGWFENMFKQYGPICRYWFFDKPKIFIGCGATALYLYGTDSLLAKSSEVPIIATLAGGQGLLALAPHIHSQRRKIWVPAFSRKQIERSMMFFRKESIRLRDELEQFVGVNNEEPPVFDLMQRSIACTFRVIVYSAFGEDYMNQLPEAAANEHMHDLHTLAVNMTARVFRPWLFNDTIYFHGTADGRETLQCIKRGNMLTKNAILIRREERLAKGLTKQYRKVRDKNGNLVLPPLQDIIDPEVTCFLDHMLNMADAGYLVEEELVDELNVFVSAGYDTTGITLCYALYFLSLYPEHQEKIVEELVQVLKEANVTSPSEMKDYQVTTADTKKMKHMELCLKETLRLYPVLPISPRSTTREVKLPDGRIIPEGVDVYILLHFIHRDPKMFPDPDKFLPERHLVPQVAQIPFSLGPRGCIGQVYGMTEMKVILCYLLMTYKWETTEGETLNIVFQTLQVPENGMHFKISKRNIDLEA